MATLRRKVSLYAAFAAIVPKLFLAYSLWVWIGVILNAIGMIVAVYFWRAVYAETAVIAGLALQTTLNYILLARIFEPLTDMNMLFEFGYNLREGGIAHVLLRPVDIQLGYYSQNLSMLVFDLARQLPLVVLASVFFGLRWPTDPAVWGAFIITALLGRTVMFLFDWLLGGLTFYTTEVWGLAVLVFGASLFFSGGLLPLDMMPDWLRWLVQAMPFAQALYAPVSVLSGVTPLAAVPQLWLVQLLWISGLLVASRVFFRVAVRKVTVQGG